MKRLFLYISIFILFITYSLHSKILHVNESGGAQAIQDSINSASLTDTVMVHNGKYYIGDLADTLGLQLWGKKLMSVSPDSAPYCTLMGISKDGIDTSKHVILNSIITNSYSIIQGFTISSGKTSPVWYRAGGGIRIELENSQPDTLLIQNNIIAENIGGGIYMTYVHRTFIQYNKILKNIGSGIYILSDEEGWPIVRKNLIKNNISQVGGGLLLHSGASPKDSLNSVLNSENSTKKAMYSMVIEDNLIIKNNANKGGGLASLHYARPLLKGNTFAYNKASFGGCIYTGGYYGSNILAEDNSFVGNVADRGGGFELDTCDWLGYFTRIFAVDNGSYNDYSGLVYQRDDFYAQPFYINYSNIYYNTYQNDRELLISSLIDPPSFFENNFWWVKDSTSVDSLIDGPSEFMPFYDWFVPGAPGEPEDIYSVLNYNSDYSTIRDSIGEQDTLYLEIAGHDRNPEFREAALAILESNIYPEGIAVALLETDTATGIYRWKASIKHTQGADTIRNDDIDQIIRVDPNGDTIRITANIDTTRVFRVYYRCYGGVKEEDTDELTIRPLRNTTTNSSFKFFLPEKGKVNLSIYDISGREVEETVSSRMNKGWHKAESGIDKPGVYLYRLKTAHNVKSGKVLIIR